MAQSAKQGAGLDCYQRNVQTRHLSAGVLSCLISWLFLFGILYKGWHGFFCQSTGIIQVCQQLLNGWINIHQKNHCTLDSAIGFPNTCPVDCGLHYPSIEQLVFYHDTLPPQGIFPKDSILPISSKLKACAWQSFVLCQLKKHLPPDCIIVNEGANTMDIGRTMMPNQLPRKRSA